MLATDWQDSGRLRGPVVGTLMTNFGLERALGERGIAFMRAKVGDRYVHQMLVEHDGVLGGEASGHLLCLDRASTGDGIVSALQVLEVLRRRGRHAARSARRHAQGAAEDHQRALAPGAKPRRASGRAGRAAPMRKRPSPAAAARSCVRRAPNRSCASRSKPTTTRSMRNILDALADAVRAAAQ